jgi:DNA-directed RNA polymerase subunit beta'
MTEEEKYSQSIAIWAEVKKVIEWKMKDWFKETNHIYNLIDSWARWNWWNITQLCWMKWLVASTTWKTIELPIKSTLKEWFSTLEYFIATHGWRKGKSDTALKTAQSWYLTRRLVDSSQNIIIKEDDCWTLHNKEISRNDKKMSFSASFEDRIYSNTLAKDVNTSDWKLLLEAWTIIDKDTVKILNKNKIEKVFIRSILTCETEWWVCKACYWLDLWLNKKTEIGTPVWVIAAQSIWEPGTQLTMRTFHSWWVAKEWWDMTQGLARVEELFEARIPKIAAEIADVDWTVKIEYTDNWKTVKLTANTIEEEEYYFWEEFEIAVKEWQEVKAKQIIARNKEKRQRITSTYAWKVIKVSSWVIIIKDIDKKVFEYNFDLWRTILLDSWEKVKRWQKITDGYLNLSKLMLVAWVLNAQKYIVTEIKSIYASQWQTVNAKHIEIIVRQMFSRVRVLDKWNTEFFPWDIIDIIKFNKANNNLLKEGKKPWIWERLLLGITKISLHTDSWLSAASFQETVRWLVESSVSWKIDKLVELKENVIIGRLIPAWKQYRKLHNEEIEWDNDYFDASEDSINTSEQHYKQV